MSSPKPGRTSWDAFCFARIAERPPCFRLARFLVFVLEEFAAGEGFWLEIFVRCEALGESSGLEDIDLGLPRGDAVMIVIGCRVFLLQQWQL